MPARFPVDVAFKGARTYLHSTDIFNFLVRETGAARKLSLKFTDMLTTPIEAVPAGDVANPDAAPARFRGETADGSQIDLVIRPSGGTEAIGRYPYDEEAVASEGRIGGSVIESTDGSLASPIERIVALNKRLILDTIKPGKKMLFASITLDHVPQAPHLRIELKSRLGVRLFRSSIASDGQALGEIIFYGA